MQFDKELENLLQARFTLVFITTSEEMRALDEVRKLCLKRGRTLIAWDVADGFEPLTDGVKPLPAAPEPKAQRNFTDPESRILKTKDGYIQGYNAQAAVDAQAQIIVAQTLSNSGNDQAQFAPLLDAIKATFKRNPDEVSADAGYCSAANLRTLSRRRIKGYIATARQKHGSKSATAKRSAKPGSLLARMTTRLRRAGHRSRYRLRTQVVEPVYGQIKEARGFRQFLLRGIEKVKAEWAMICTAHNLRKLALAA